MRLSLSPEDTRSDLFIAQVFAELPIQFRRCNTCCRALQLNLQLVVLQCGCLFCLNCFDKQQLGGSPLRWSTRSSNRRNEDSVWICTGRVRDRSLGGAIVTCKAPIHLEYQVHQPSSFLTPTLAAELNLPLPSLASPSSYNPFSSIAVEANASTTSIPNTSPSNITLDPLPTTPPSFPVKGKSTHEEAKSIIERGAAASQHLNLPKYKSYHDGSEPDALRELFSRKPSEWAELVVREMKDFEKQYLVGRHNQLGIGQSLSPQQLVEWIKPFVKKMSVSRSQHEAVVYDILSIISINYSSSHIPTIPLFANASDSTKAIADNGLPLPSNSSTYTTGSYGGSATSQLAAEQEAIGFETEKPNQSEFGIRHRASSLLLSTSSSPASPTLNPLFLEISLDGLPDSSWLRGDMLSWSE